MRQHTKTLGTRLASAGVVATVASLILTAGAAPYVPTDRQLPPPPRYFEWSVIDKMSLRNQIGSQVFATCLVRLDGGTCSINKGESVSREVQLALGMTWAGATAQLGISQSKTVTISVTCTSPALKAGQRWKARSVGTKYYYKIRKKTLVMGQVIKTEKSSQLTAFNPRASDIACGLL